MKLAEIQMGHEARDLARGSLSPQELELAGPPPEAAREREDLETWLYFHLDTARRARIELDSVRSWSGHFTSKYREREQALARASEIYRQLLTLAGAMPADLAAMALNEGLTP
jgi:hypothetical protein